MISSYNVLKKVTGRAISAWLPGGDSTGVHGSQGFSAGVHVGNSSRSLSATALLAAAMIAVAMLTAACSRAAANQALPTVRITPPPTPAKTAPPVGPHGGVNLNVLVVADATSAVEAVSQELATEG